MGVVSNLSKNHELVLTGAFVWKMRDIAMMIPFIWRLIQFQNTRPLSRQTTKSFSISLSVSHKTMMQNTFLTNPQLNDTVDGSEIRLSPVEVGSLSYLRRVSVTSPVVVWDFLTINSTILPTWNEFHQGTPLIEPSLTSLLHPFAGTKCMRNVSAKPVPGTNGSGCDGCTPVEQLPGPNLSSWWFQPIWKRWSSILDHFHRERGEIFFKKSLKPPPSYCWFFQMIPLLGNATFFWNHFCCEMLFL